MFRKKKSGIPSKKTINLAFREKSEFTVTRTLPSLLLVAALAIAFSHFAVLDRLDHVAKLNRTVEELQQQVSALESACEGYEETEREYSRYFSADLTDEEKALHSRTLVLELVEEQLMPYCDVKTIRTEGNTVTIQLGGITLDKASALINTIETKAYVQQVSVFSAATGSDDHMKATIIMMIRLNDNEGDVRQ